MDYNEILCNENLRLKKDLDFLKGMIGLMKGHLDSGSSSYSDDQERPLNVTSLKEAINVSFYWLFPSLDCT